MYKDDVLDLEKILVARMGASFFCFKKAIFCAFFSADYYFAKILHSGDAMHGLNARSSFLTSHVFEIIYVKSNFSYEILCVSLQHFIQLVYN